ncbi:MAG: tRNA (adenosine(37)-N6)-threonylcarbamoyltransferase complex dimerization subunit type 1 TsaB [Terriglobales bacterium]
MLLLVIDTSDKEGSIALAQGQDDGLCDVIESAQLAGGMFSAQLVPQVASLLASHHFNKHQIDGFIAVSGPGSFTGLRVGLAAIKGLAEVLGKRIVTVSLLEVLAIAGGVNGTVTAVLDAGRGEVYLGSYQVENSVATLVSESLVPRNAVLDSVGCSTIVTSDKTVAETLHAKNFRFVKKDRPSIGAVARLGLQKLVAGETISPEDLEANYIGRSDSQMFSATKS